VLTLFYSSVKLIDAPEGFLDRGTAMTYMTENRRTS